MLHEEVIKLVQIVCEIYTQQLVFEFRNYQQTSESKKETENRPLSPIKQIIKQEGLIMEGKWNFTVHTFMGDMRSTYELKVVGDKIEGTATDAANGATAPVDNGTFDGTNFSWDMTIKTAVGEMTNHLTGKFEGDKLTGKSANAMGEFEFDAVRA